MEGKGVLFKRFADIDVFDIELATQDPRKSSAPASCWSRPSGASTSKTSRRPNASSSRRSCAHDEDPGLPRRPARHGDHLRRGADLNAVELAGKRLSEVRWSSTAPAPAASPAPEHYLGSACGRRTSSVRQQGRHLRGAQARDEPYKERFARRTDARTLAEAMRGADVFVAGCRWPTASRRKCSARWPTIRSSSPWPIPTRRFLRAEAKCARAPTSSWPPAAPTTPTR
jgi:malate dehydrogenase (oxaloacetate-decarboxylating)(NADP+)